MKKIHMNYRVQDIPSCTHCKHCRQSGCDIFYCSIMEIPNDVNVFGICDSFKDWRK